MGIENLRRWPMYIVFAVCMLLLLSLFNSWTLETELRERMAEITLQLHRCSKLEATCMQESLTVLEQRDLYQSKVNSLTNKVEMLADEKSKLANEINDYKIKITKHDTRVNHTLADVELCKTELQSFKNLQLSKSATLEALRLEKDTLTTQLTERKERIEELQKEVEKLKSALTTKSPPKPIVSQATPAAALPKLSPVMNAPIDEPALENAAKEEMEDSNPQDMDDIDPNIQ